MTIHHDRRETELMLVSLKRTLVSSAACSPSHNQTEECSRWTVWFPMRVSCCCGSNLRSTFTEDPAKAIDDLLDTHAVEEIRRTKLLIDTTFTSVICIGLFVLALRICPPLRHFVSTITQPSKLTTSSAFCPIKLWTSNLLFYLCRVIRTCDNNKNTYSFSPPLL